MDTLTTPRSIQITIQVPSGNIYIDDGGKSGIPILFVHSFGGNTQHWVAQLNHLRDSGRRTIAMDMRGHGKSAAPSDMNYSVDSLALDIAAVADSLKLKKFVLVGHSMGGSVVIAYAGKFPDKVAGLVLVGTPGKSTEQQAKPIIASLESDQYDKVMQDYMNQMLTNAKPETDRIEREGMDRISKEHTIRVIKAVFKFDPLPALKKYKGPALIISADGEKQSNALYVALPQIPHQTIPGTSHWVHMDKPEEFNLILDEFLKSIES